MKKVLIALFAFALPALMMANNDTEGKKTFNVDKSKSSIAWKGYKVTGEHAGTINIASGEMQVKDGQITGGSFVIDMSSIEVTDISGEYADKLKGHLKSDDFFGVTAYPTANLKITNVKQNGDVYEMTADLTIKETTEQIVFETTMANNGGVMTTTSNLKIDRSKYNVRYGSPSFFDDLGDKAIYNDFDLNVVLVFTEGK